MKKEQEKTTAYIDRDDWLKFLKKLRRLLEKKMVANPDSECIIVRREELNQCWPEVQDKERHQRHFAKSETVATILDAALDFSVVADSQNGEKLKFYENKKGHYGILKEYRKRQRLLVILFVIADIFTCLSVALMIFNFFNFANIITVTLFVFLDLLLINVIDKNELKSKELRKIEKTIKMIQ